MDCSDARSTRRRSGMPRHFRRRHLLNRQAAGSKPNVNNDSDSDSNSDDGIESGPDSDDEDEKADDILDGTTPGQPGDNLGAPSPGESQSLSPRSDNTLQPQPTGGVRTNIPIFSHIVPPRPTLSGAPVVPTLFPKLPETTGRDQEEEVTTTSSSQTTKETTTSRNSQTTKSQDVPAGSVTRAPESTTTEAITSIIADESTRRGATSIQDGAGTTAIPEDLSTFLTSISESTFATSISESTSAATTAVEAPEQVGSTSGGSTNTGTDVGILIGTVSLAGMLIGVAIFFYKRRKSAKDQLTNLSPVQITTSAPPPDPERGIYAANAWANRDSRTRGAQENPTYMYGLSPPEMAQTTRGYGAPIPGFSPAAALRDPGRPIARQSGVGSEASSPYGGGQVTGHLVPPLRSDVPRSQAGPYA
ncbi:uncharacterized protein F5Z01DRAFT_477498 [Emericellopsis atlantica]|uniref:Uncharacterized protein n=1 Tax=Emericellopsis atlantica TaxID=2614577 RepID=A0A9P8CRQ1_9HYPO|nr:uncharacterized protein F5Z01DRAFT_477498 [Emericellopsis atlantica]KAG9256557.1 hypothetical protein F5Z01DRAFT_477498 [Emericellopsis atlantica]